jgi:hypothetical protein
MLMDVIPLDASLVRGSHGCQPGTNHWPVLISQRRDLCEGTSLKSTDIFRIIHNHVLG